MVAALEHCDALVSGHSYAALAEVVEAIGAPSDRLGRAPAETSSSRRRRRRPGRAPRRCPGAPSRCRAATGRAGAGRPRDGRSVSETERTCIYPGCDRPAVPPHPLGGPQPAFCDLEQHNALTAHQQRQRLAERPRPTRRRAMADEAYRAVFLRVHPTGKMVLSLTTESDGTEAEYAALVAGELGVPALDVKVVAADTDRSARPRLQHEPLARHLRRGRDRQREDPRQGAAARGVAMDAPAESLEWSNGAWTAPAARRGRSRTWRSTRTAPGPCRRASRAGSTRRPSTGTRPRLGAALERDLDLVGDLERAEQRRVRLHAPVALLDHGPRRRPRRRRPARGRRRSGGVPGERQLALDVEDAAGPGAAAVERKAISRRFRTSSSIVCWMFSMSSSSSAWKPPVPSRTRSEVGSAVSSSSVPAGLVGERDRRLPGGDVDEQVVPGLGRRAGALRVHREGRVLGSEPMSTRRGRHAASI